MYLTNAPRNASQRDAVVVYATKLYALYTNYSIGNNDIRNTFYKFTILKID